MSALVPLHRLVVRIHQRAVVPRILVVAEPPRRRTLAHAHSLGACVALISWRAGETARRARERSDAADSAGSDDGDALPKLGVHVPMMSPAGRARGARRHAHPSPRGVPRRGVSHRQIARVAGCSWVRVRGGVDLLRVRVRMASHDVGTVFSRSATGSRAWLDGYWRASRDWCFPREDARAFPLIRQPDVPTALEASPVASGALTEVPGSSRDRIPLRGRALSRDRPALIEGLTIPGPPGGDIL